MKTTATDNGKYSEFRSLRAAVRGIYQIQKVRVAVGLRIVAAYRAKIGVEPSKKPSDKEAKELLGKLVKSHKSITDGAVSALTAKNFKPRADGLISNWTELSLITLYLDTKLAENHAVERLKAPVHAHPLWYKAIGLNKDLGKGGPIDLYRGCGEGMCAVLISEVNIHKCKYPSSLWKYAGLDVLWNEETQQNEGRGNKKAHLVEKEYTDKDGKPAVRDSITYNPFLKAKMVEVLATCFIRIPGGCHYRDIYLDQKHRLQNHVKYGIAATTNKKGEDKGIGHRDRMAKRYMIKIFLREVWREWRTLEGLPVPPPYEEAKLGMSPHKQPESVPAS